MAGRKAALRAIDWMAFAERVPPNQKAMFNALKTRSDTVAAKLTSLPEKPPAIDWAFYRTAVQKAGMVEEFEKKFTSITVPEPKDTQTELINTQEQESAKQAASYIQESKVRVSQYEKEGWLFWGQWGPYFGQKGQLVHKLERYKNMIPFDQMTFEDLHQAFPETRLDKEKHVYWPHKPISEL